MMKWIITIMVAAIIVAVGVVLFTRDNKNFSVNRVAETKNSSSNSTNPYTGQTSRQLAMICDMEEHVVFHIHPVLTITINDQVQTVSPDIGIETTCLHFLHTHDSTGTLHVESPIQIDYHLSDFFAVWGKTFNKDQILDTKVDDKHRIRMMVDGQESIDYENVVLKDEEKIDIFYERKF